MIDTDKYEGHTKGDATTPDSWRIVGDNFVMNGESPSFRFIAYAQQHDGRHTLVGFSDADAQLIADAPLILEEVKRLREQLAKANKYVHTICQHSDSMLMDYEDYMNGDEEE